MNLGSLSNVTGVTIYKFFKYLRRFIVVLLVKCPHPFLERLDNILVWNVTVAGRDRCALSPDLGFRLSNKSPHLGLPRSHARTGDLSLSTSRVLQARRRLA